jgi:sodium-independent sulfate anion transporter 11
VIRESVVPSLQVLYCFVPAKGKAVDASQELFALGLSNIMSSFVRSFPLAGSFSRTAVNNASGVKTPLGGLMTGKKTELVTSFQYIYNFSR